MNQTIFFLLIISWLIAASCQQNQAEQILQEEVIRSQEEARLWVQDNGVFWYNSTAYELEDVSRQRFLPVLECLDSINQTCQTAQQYLGLLLPIAAEADQLVFRDVQNAQQAKKELDSLKQRLCFYYRNLLQNYHDSLGLTQKQADESQRYLDKNLTSLNAASLWEHITSLSAPSQILAIRTMQLDWESANTMLVNNLGAGRFMGCSRGIIQYTLQVTPAQNFVRTGEVFKARISLLHNDDNYVHAKLKILVDGVEQPLVAGHFAEYVSESLSLPEKVINITALIEHPLTGKMEEAFPEFTYTIKTKQ